MKRASLDTVLQLIHQAATLQSAAADCMKQAANVLQNEFMLHDNVKAPPVPCHRDLLPLVDLESLAVYWAGRTCEMGATVLLRLLCRLARRPGCFVRMNDLLQDVWEGNIKSPSTVRSAVRRLKHQLEHAGMHALAHSIRCEGGRYGLVLNSR